MVTWTNLTDGHSATGSVLSKSGDNWTADATGTTTWNSGTLATVEYTISNNSIDAFCGFDSISNLDSYSMDYALYTGGSGSINIYENGSVVSSNVTSYTASDTFKVNMATDGTVTYLKNDTVFYTSSTIASGEYRVNAVMYTGGESITAELLNPSSSSGGSGSSTAEEGSITPDYILYLSSPPIK